LIEGKGRDSIPAREGGKRGEEKAGKNISIFLDENV